MKLSSYSLNYARAIKQGQMDVFRFLATCRELGLEGASVHLGDLPRTGPDVLARVRRAYLDNFLSVAMFTVSTNYGRDGDAGLAEGGPIREAIRSAAFLGAPLLRVFAGSSGADRAAAWARAVSGVRRTCEEAARVGLPVGLQNHNHGGLCATGADVLRFVKEVDHPNLTVVLDCGQFLGSGGASGAPASGLREADLYESIRQVAPWRATSASSSTAPGPTAPSRSSTMPAPSTCSAPSTTRASSTSCTSPRRRGASRSPRRCRGSSASSARLLRADASPREATSGRYDGLDNAKYFADQAPRTETSLAFTEGPTVDGAGVVYFTNAPTDQILAWDPRRRSRSVFRDRSGQANGLIFDREGRLVACEASGRITRTDMATGQVAVLADGYNGHAARRAQRPRHRRSGADLLHLAAGQHRPPEGERQRRVPDRPRRDGRPHPGGARGRHAERSGGRARRRDVLPDRRRRPRGPVPLHPRLRPAPDGTVSNGRVLYDFAPGRSGDGMSVDAEGNLYVAAGLHRRRGGSETLDTRPGLHVVSPQGKLLAFVETPEDLLTNCTFGGPDRRTLYITCGKLLLSLRTRIPGKAV